MRSNLPLRRNNNEYQIPVNFVGCRHDDYVQHGFAPVCGVKSEVYKNWRGLAIKGYDPVAYYKEGKPVKGSNKLELKWKDATWRFASTEHRDLFKADPENIPPATADIVPGPLLRDLRRAFIRKTPGRSLMVSSISTIMSKLTNSGKKIFRVTSRKPMQIGRVC